MAGVEKICEVTGESCGWKMYKWKRDLIQVQPSQLHLFQKVDAVLYFFEQPSAYNYTDNQPNPFLCVSLFKKSFFIHKVWTRFYWQWKRIGRPFYCCPTFVWDYMLYVPGVPGIVNKQYWNHTCHPERALSNLYKLVGKLTVIPVPMTFYEFYQARENLQCKTLEFLDKIC